MAAQSITAGAPTRPFCARSVQRQLAYPVCLPANASTRRQAAAVCKENFIFSIPCDVLMALGDIAENQKLALRNMSKVSHEKWSHGSPLQNLVVFVFDPVDGEVSNIVTATSQSAVRIILTQMFHHATRDIHKFPERFDLLTSALSEFYGGVLRTGAAASWSVDAGIDSFVTDAANTVAASIIHEMEDWIQQSSLEHRHAAVLQHLFAETIHDARLSTNDDTSCQRGRLQLRAAPALLSLVEYDREWQRLGGFPPEYSVVNGRGSASIVFDTLRLSSPQHIRLPSTFVRGLIKPKSSCLVVLEQRDETAHNLNLPLLLACTVHLTSAPPSETRKVRLRRVSIVPIDHVRRHPHPLF